MISQLTEQGRKNLNEALHEATGIVLPENFIDEHWDKLIWHFDTEENLLDEANTGSISDTYPRSILAVLVSRVVTGNEGMWWPTYGDDGSYHTIWQIRMINGLNRLGLAEKNEAWIESREVDITEHINELKEELDDLTKEFKNEH